MTPTAYDITVTPDPVPGRTVTVRVERDDQPVIGAQVAFNGEQIGETNRSGEVRGAVPYVEELRVQVTPAPEATKRVEGVVSGVGSRPAGVARQATPENLTEVYDLPTDVVVRVDGTPDPGATLHVTAILEQTPVRDAGVRVNGERVGRTDDRGRIELRVPDDGTERLRVTVSRGTVTGRTTVVVRLLDATVTPAGVFAMPGGRAVVQATLADRPRAGASVSVGGRRIGTTDENGTTSLQLPVDPRATVVVTDGDRRVARPVTPLYAGTAVVGVAAGYVLALLLVGGGGTILRGRKTAVAVLTAGLWALGRGVRHVTAAIRWLGRWFGRAALVTPRRIVRTLAVLPGRLAAGLHTTVRWLRGGNSPGLDSARSERGRREARGRVERSIAALWRAFARRVLPNTWARRTPGEVGRAAVRRGFPREPVVRVTAAFREIEYGDGALPDEHREAIRSEFERLQEEDDA